MTDEELVELLRKAAVSSGHRLMTLEDIARIQPGLGRLMPEVGHRAWKLYYAAEAKNWPLAAFQAKEIKGLLELCAFTRPKHEEALGQFLKKNWTPVEAAIAHADFADFEQAFQKAISATNGYHKLKGKPYIIWKLPEAPPPDLDMQPQEKD